MPTCRGGAIDLSRSAFRQVVVWLAASPTHVPCVAGEHAWTPWRPPRVYWCRAVSFAILGGYGHDRYDRLRRRRAPRGTQSVGANPAHEPDEDFQTRARQLTPSAALEGTFV